MRNTISLDFCENYIADSRLDEQDENNGNRIKRAAFLVKRVIAQELTPRQREMCSMYYFQKLDMPTIAQELGVNKSTVCRTIARGLARVTARLKYYKLR